MTKSLLVVKVESAVYNIIATKVTSSLLANKACSFTLHNQGESKLPLRKLYGSEHSPMRTQMFWIEMRGIPSFVSTHLVRHKIGIEHYVQTNRVDRGSSTVSYRLTPINHAMLCNAQALINMARKRFCTHASSETREVMVGIKNAVKRVDDALAEFMVVDCVYRGQCYEPSCCGMASSYWESPMGRSPDESKKETE